MKRRKVGYRRSKRIFARTARKVNRKNLTRKVYRGGFRF